MTAPFLSLAQIRNRLTLTARRINRDQARHEGRCPVCGVSVTDILRGRDEVQQLRRRMIVPSGRSSHEHFEGQQG
ncbi:hypothetical protein [Micromonospora sp. NPDC047134]|uniref:hypothetical protein n=1 Tax=Micromonospora sp. NPDC047134 TaxID=3154340 RepID=UPI0033E117D8